MKTVSLTLAFLVLVINSPLARAQVGGQFTGISQCFVNGAWVTVQGDCPSAGARSTSSPSPVSSPSSTGTPEGVQLLNVDTDPTLRIPVDHVCDTPKNKFVRALSGSHGWLEISRKAIRYQPAARGRFGSDLGFEGNRSDVIDVEMFPNSQGFIRNQMVKFHIRDITHYYSYSAPSHWQSHEKEIIRADDVYSPLILRALQNFEGVAEEYGAKPPAAPTLPAPVAPPVASDPKPAPPSAPPVVMVLYPTGASDKGTVEVIESPLTIRGVAMDSSGMPMVTIDGAPAALRPKDAHAVEFWSDPLLLKPGERLIHITASNPANAKTGLTFTIRYAPPPRPVNPKALDKAEIIALLQGGVSAARAAELIKENGLKFNPTEDDLKDLRTAGGDESLIQVIQQAARPR